MHFLSDLGLAIYWIFVIASALLVVAGGFVVLIAIVDGLKEGRRATRRPPNNGD